jgi:phosphatidate cytidylyltransferase
MQDLFQKAEGTKPHLPSYFVGILPLAQWMQIAYYPELPLVDLAFVLLAL